MFPGRSRSRLRLLYGVVLVWSLSGLHPVPPSVANADDAVRTPRIQGAIDRALNVLKRQAPNTIGGRKSLLALALLKGGEPADLPEIQAAIDFILERIVSGKYRPSSDHEHIYESSVSLMALANADAKKYRPQISAIADYIMSQQGPAGDWDYPMRGTGDTSISQYAILGLWEAVRSGVPVPGRVWDRAANWHVSRQCSDGSFTYHPNGLNPGEVGTFTMTVAGTGSLHVCRMHLYPDARDIELADRPKGKSRKFGVLEVADTDEEKTEGKEANASSAPYHPTVRLAAIDRSITRGTDWLESRFTVAPNTPWNLYYLYGLERLAALGGLDKFAGHDWYDEGTEYLLIRQVGDGGWTDNAGPVPATSFGVLFLTKATAKMLQRAPRRPKFGAGLLAGGRGLPDNLSEVQVEKGQVQVRKLAGPIDELLAELENARGTQVESAQAALVEKVAVDNPASLVGQKERLLVLVKDRRAEVRRTAYWALGRTDDLRVAPVLIAGLLDGDASCVQEAERALRFLSKKAEGVGAPAVAVAQWKKWYKTVRPYDERDDLSESDR